MTDWKEKALEIPRAKRTFWRVIVGTSIIIILLTISLFILRDIIIAWVK